MKRFIPLFLLSLSYGSIWACTCAGPQSFCNRIQNDYFKGRGGIVCLAETTGNYFGDYLFNGAEMKIIDLLYGELQPGTNNYLNSDSTFWILANEGALCFNNSTSFHNEGKQYIMAPI